MTTAPDKNKKLDETEALDTLKPGAKSVSDDKAISPSRVAMMKQILYMTSTLGSEDLTHLFASVDAQVKKNMAATVDASAANQSTIDMKGGNKGTNVKAPMITPNVAGTPGQSVTKEDLQVLFVGAELTEDFVEKATKLFEDAVETKAILKAAELQEQLDAKVKELDEQYATKLTAEITKIEESVDKYLDDVTVKFLEENEVALEAQLKSELNEALIADLRALFLTHNVTIPEDQYDVAEGMTKKVDELQKALDEKITEVDGLRKEALARDKKSAIAGVSEGLAMTQREKFEQLAEELEFDGDLAVFEEKLEAVKTKYFATAAAPKSNILEETFEGGNDVKEAVVDPVMDQISRAISRTVKR
jgi:hypothetical protein